MHTFKFAVFLFVLLSLSSVTFAHRASAQNYCDSISNSLEKTCKQTPVDLCDLNDDLMFRKLVRLAERANTVSRAQFNKYQSLLKASPTAKTLKELHGLEAEVNPCLTATHALWILLLKHGTVKTHNKASVERLIRDKLLNDDLYSFTLDSLRERMFLIQEAVALDLILLGRHQADRWKSIVESFKQAKEFSPDHSAKIPYSEKSDRSERSDKPEKSERSEKLARPPEGSSVSVESELARLNEVFLKVRAGHQQINEFFP